MSTTGTGPTIPTAAPIPLSPLTVTINDEKYVSAKQLEELAFDMISRSVDCNADEAASMGRWCGEKLRELIRKS